jgi:hypothetical protein
VDFLIILDKKNMSDSLKSDAILVLLTAFIFSTLIRLLHTLLHTDNNHAVKPINAGLFLVLSSYNLLTFINSSQPLGRHRRSELAVMSLIHCRTIAHLF